jgi:Zn finger protein HypA/HybF involved in hydrogenase expression
MIAKTSCQQCGVHIEFEVEDAGQIVSCPSCGQQTSLLMPNRKPAEAPPVVEAKCNCQRCGNQIAFPVDLNNTEVECPHCHKATTLLLPSPESRIRAIRPPVVSPQQGQASVYGDLGGLVFAGYLTAIFLPLIGFIIGIVLIAKNRPGSGIGCIIVSIICAFFALAILSNGF